MKMEATRVLVVGSRDLMASDVKMSEIFDMFVEECKSYQLIHRHSPGADMIAGLEAIRRGWDMNGLKLDKDDGMAAEFVRDLKMEEQNPEIVIGFIKEATRKLVTDLKFVARAKSIKTIYLWDEGEIHIFTPQALLDYLKK